MGKGATIDTGISLKSLKLDKPKIKKIFNHLKKYPGKLFSVNDIAHKFGCSRSLIYNQLIKTYPEIHIKKHFIEGLGYRSYVIYYGDDKGE